MRFSKLLIAGILASSLVAVPAMANSASALSVAKAANVKAVTSSKKSSKLAQNVVPFVVIGGVAAAVMTVALVTDDDDSDSN